MSGDTRIVIRPEIFHETFVPTSLPERAKQVDDLAWCLAPLLKRNGPTHAWLHGPAGSGKTAVVRHVVEACSKKANIPTAWVNGFDRRTVHAILDRVLSSQRVLGVEARSTAFKIDRLHSHLAGKPIIIVLDEIDRVATLDRNDVLYNLLADSRTCLICVATSTRPLAFLDPRVRSRFNPQIISFPAYSEIELVAILLGKVEFGLKDGACDEKTIAGLAHAAAGDARVAIQALRNAARLAEKEHSARIQEKHVELALASTRQVKDAQTMASLTQHHRLLAQIVRARGEITSGELLADYRAACAAKQLQPIASRTFIDYMNTLVRVNLVSAEWSVKKGRTRLFRAGGAPDGGKSD